MLRIYSELGFFKCRCSALSKNLGRILRVGTSEHEAVQSQWSDFNTLSLIWKSNVVRNCHIPLLELQGSLTHNFKAEARPAQAPSGAPAPAPCSTASLTAQPVQHVHRKSSLV